MKDFFITIMFIVIFFGGSIFLLLLPFLLRDWLRRSRRKKRQQRFFDGLESLSNQVFEISVRFYKEDLNKILSIEHRQQFPLLAKVFLTPLFILWVAGGLHGIWEMITGQEPQKIFDWVRCLIGVLLGLRIFWVMWISCWLLKKNIAEASDLEVSRVSETDYKISSDGIRVTIQGDEGDIIEWKQVDRIVEEPDAIRIMFVSRDFLWIPRDALFRSGEWEGLITFLGPFDAAKDG